MRERIDVHLGSRLRTICLEMKSVDIATLYERLQGANPPMLVDVRTATEYDGGHVPEAVLIPLGAVAQRADELRGKGPVHLICRSGSRSAQAGSFLEQAGVDVVNVDGGTSAWARAGYAIVAERSWRRLLTPLILSLTLGLAPFSPEPHLVGKLRWLAGGAVGMGAQDYFDVVMHGAPFLWLLWTAVAVLRTPPRDA